MSDMPTLQARVRQLERENANLALKMEAENLMPDCNMLLAENFVQPDSIDRFSVQVTSCAAGDDSVDVVSNYGIITGSWYWITDEIHAEYVQVKSVIRNGSIYRVIFSQKLKQTYQIEKTKIYRTTAWINDSGTVYGSGDVKGINYSPKVTWKGTTEGGTAESNEEMELGISYADNYDNDGYIYFTNDNLMTL